MKALQIECTIVSDPFLQPARDTPAVAGAALPASGTEAPELHADSATAAMANPAETGGLCIKAYLLCAMLRCTDDDASVGDP